MTKITRAPCQPTGPKPERTDYERRLARERRQDQAANTAANLRKRGRRKTDCTEAK